jgi:hypothetical protein
MTEYNQPRAAGCGTFFFSIWRLFWFTYYCVDISCHMSCLLPTHTLVLHTYVDMYYSYVCVCCVYTLYIKRKRDGTKNIFSEQSSNVWGMSFFSSSSSSSYSYCCFCWLYIRQTWMLRRECGTRPPTCYFLIRKMLIYLFLNPIQNKRARFYFNSDDCWQPSNSSFLFCI